ncbi:hypothetical protein MtrunA17_Chr7g0249111 [Medicago truncatula]|uniref:Transmembrane protein, putative n=1 Tax=Medicago truncatula TaxID=3880 RepID=G7KQM4_MEDTR|nr:transmembrane protein, putative [Medicago truncatula]RHN47084.1 hypothetical protein MtrunA17_Chr7g0249111 [Medicago truncatula]
MMMESPDLSPPQVGTALLLLIIFSLSGIFSCCYHWEKFLSLHQSLSHLESPQAHTQ